MSQFNMDKVFAEVETKFKTYRSLVEAVARGSIRHLFVEGSSGLGKSFEAELVLEDFAKRRKIRYHRAAGHITPLSLFNTLQEWRTEDDVLLFDDCDTVFETEQCLNILKAATDTKEVRKITWGSTSKLVNTPEFVYEGSLIIITNHDLQRGKLKNLMDRVHFFNLELSLEEKVGRILAVLYSMSKHAAQRDQVILWIIEHYPSLGEQLTLRTAIKCLELAAFNQDNWKELAGATILGRIVPGGDDE